MQTRWPKTVSPDGGGGGGGPLGETWRVLHIPVSIKKERNNHFLH